jgi:hypothetical protein
MTACSPSSIVSALLFRVVFQLPENQLPPVDPNPPRAAVAVAAEFLEELEAPEELDETDEYPQKPPPWPPERELRQGTSWP